MMMNDIMVMKRLPMSVIAHSGILSKNPQSSMAETISDGSTADWGCPKPAACMMVEITPCTMSNSASIKAVKDVSEQWKQEVAG